MKQAVIWTKTHEKVKRNLRKWLIFTNLFWIIISLFLYQGWVRINEIDPEVSSLKNQIKEYRGRDEIFNILRVKGISLSQGIDIANALIIHSRENKIPLELGLAIMKKESRFYINAISDKNAKGLMQLMPETFDSYNKAFNMGLSRQAIFDPIVNIRIAFLHLKDIYEEVSKKTIKKSYSGATDYSEVWPVALNAYSGGAINYAKTVMASSEEFREKLK